MKNILHAIDTTGPGGAETVFIDLLSRLDKEEFRSVVLIRGKGWVYDELRRRGYEPIIVPAKGSFNFKYLLGLLKIIRKEKIDLIQSHLFGSNVYCCLAGMITRTPVVATFHGGVDFKNERFLSVKFKIINKLSSYIVVVSDDLKRQLLANIPLDREKLRTIYNGVDLSRFYPDKNKMLREELGLDETDLLVGSIGNIRGPKGYDVLIRAAADVVQKNPDIKFVIAGENKNSLYDELLELRNSLGLENNLFFLGFRDRVEELLNGIDIFLLSSTSEGFSISTIEAMACGVPVIATRSGGPQEIITDKQDGLLIEPGSSESISQAILYLAGTSQSKESYAGNAAETVKNRFSIGTMVGEYERLYQL